MIFTAIGTAIAGALFAGSALAASVIAGGLAFGASLLVSTLTRKTPSRPSSQPYSAVQGQVQYGANVPVQALYGTGKVKGHQVFYAKWGSGNKFNADVFVLSNGWCDGLEPSVYFFGQKYDLTTRAIIGNEAAHYGVAGFGSLISIRFYDGRPGQGVDTKLVADTAGLGNTWKGTSVCAGLTYVVVEREYDAALFEKGRPDFEFVLRGLREYDPRADSTVAGGSGAHRIDNPSTWAYSQNPALHRLNYQIGLRGLISGRTLIGEGKSLGQIDLGSYFAAMNVCDTLRNGKPTYACSIFVTGEDDHTEVLKEFDDAMAGYALNRRGLSGVIPGAPQIPVLEITANDIPVARAQDLQRRKSAFDLYNYISGQFTSPESLWNPESLTPVTVNLDVAADGRPRQTSNDFLQVTDADIAQYLLNIRYRQNRKGGSVTLPVSRRVGLRVQEGEWVLFDGTEWLITGWRCDAQFRCTLQLAETGADVYSDEGIEPGPIVVPSAPPINPSLLSTVQNFNVEVGLIEAADDQEVPALRFTWTPPADPSITAVRFFYFVGDDPTGQTIFQDRSDDSESGEYVTSKNVVPGVYYTARATITTVPDRFKTFTPYVTTDVVTGPFDVFKGVVGFPQLDATMSAIIARFGVNMREFSQQMQAIAVLLGDQDLANAATFNEVRREVSTAVGDLSASFTEVITVQVTPINGRLTAIADVVTELGAGEGGDINTVRSRMTAQDGPDGYSSIMWQARSPAEVGYREAGLGVDVPNDTELPSKVWVVADQFIVKFGAASLDFFIVDGAGLHIVNAFIKNLTADNIDVEALTASTGFFDNLEATWAQIDSAVVGNFVATSANIGALAVTTVKIQNGAVTDLYSASISTSAGSGGTTLASLNIALGSYPVTLAAYVNLTRTNLTYTNAALNLYVNGVMIKTVGPVSVTSHTSGSDTVYDSAYFTFGEISMPGAPGTNTYSLVLALSGFAGTAYTVTGKFSATLPQV